MSERAPEPTRRAVGVYDRPAAADRRRWPVPPWWILLLLIAALVVAALFMFPAKD